MTDNNDQKKSRKSPSGRYAFNDAVEDANIIREEDMVAVTTSKVDKKKQQEKAAEEQRLAAERAQQAQATGFSFDQDDEDDGIGDIKLKGNGWIRCEDGTLIKDNGGSLYIKGHPPTEAQLKMVLAIAHERNWGKLAVWKPGGREIDQKVTDALEQRGCACCRTRKEAGSFTKDQELGTQLWKEKVLEARRAAAAQDADKAIDKAKAVPHLA